MRQFISLQNMKSSTLLSLAALAAAATSFSIARAETLYGLTFFGDELIAVDSNTGSSSLIGSLGTTVSGYGLAARGSTLYTFDPNTDGLRAINKMTGAAGASINLGVGDLTGEGDLAFRSDGVGFLSSALAPDFSPVNQLFRFDAELGTSTLVANTAIPLDGMVFVGNTLYAIGQEAEAKLYTVDQTNGALSVVGALGIAQDSPFGALAATSNGELFGAINDRLYSIDPITGAASVVNADVLDLGYASVSGLASSPAFTPVPEPSVYALGGVALIVLAKLVRRRSSPVVVPSTS